MKQTNSAAKRPNRFRTIRAFRAFRDRSISDTYDVIEAATARLISRPIYHGVPGAGRRVA